MLRSKRSPELVVVVFEKHDDEGDRPEVRSWARSSRSSGWLFADLFRFDASVWERYTSELRIEITGIERQAREVRLDALRASDGEELIAAMQPRPLARE